MAGNRCLLDTSIIINAFRKDNAIAQKLDNVSEIFVPVIVVGELRYGAYKSSDPERNIQQIKLFMSNCKLLGLNNTTATFYGRIKTELAQKGKPIPENDSWIAAIAQQYHLPIFYYR